MIRIVRRVFVVLIIFALIGAVIYSSKTNRGRKITKSANDNIWKLVSNDPDNKYGTYLGNGYISTRIMGDGVGSQNGNPLPCYIAGLYVNEKLIPCPTWSDLRFLYDGEEFKLDKYADYEQTLDMKSGILTTKGTWKLDDKTLTGSIDIILSRAEPNLALIRAKFIPNFDGTINVTNPIKTNDSLSLLSPKHYPSQKYYLFPTFDKNHWVCIISYLNNTIKVEKNKDFTINCPIQVYIGSTSVSWLPTPTKTPFKSEDIIIKHKAAWAKLWESDIIIDGLPKDQQAIHSCMFYLLQSVREGVDWSIPPMGLSSNDFNGHIFWDADVWMFPALILQHPELAKSIVNYRFKTLFGAIENAKKSGFKGAEYAWESGYSGIEDVPVGLVYINERHINGDVALAQWQYFLATGDVNWLKIFAYPVLSQTADYWVNRSVFNKNANRYEILQVVPPDENAGLVNNSAYTNAIAKLNLEFAISAAKLTNSKTNPKWAEVASKMYIPIDKTKNRYLAHDNYKNERLKQADVEMLIYPLQIAQDKLAENTYAFYSSKVIPNGPAMTSSVQCVIAARLGRYDEAYSKFKKSYQPYFRGPFNYFNEKKSKTYEKMCFLTGAAGPIQATLFGILGFQMDYNKPLSTEFPILKPSLPKEWKKLTVTNVQWRGKKCDIIVKKGNKVIIKKRI